ncbi:MAG: hypothetical protein AB1696_18635 [Planctomycetota bacterium]
MAKTGMTIYCGECGAGFRVDAALAGKQFRCPNCKARLPLPSSFSERPQIRLFCPNCGAKVRAWAEQGGEDMNCPKCGEEIHLPKIAKGETAKKEDAGKKLADTLPIIETVKKGKEPPPPRLDETEDEEEEESDEGEETEEEEGKEEEEEIEIKPDKVLDRHAESKLPSFRKARSRKVHVFCPTCGKRVERDPAEQGKRLHCPFCHAEFAPAAKAVQKAEAKPQRTEMLIARTTCEILGILLVFIGAALVGKSLAMGAWQELMGLDASGARVMGLGMCVLGPIFLLIGGFANFRGFLAASFLVGAVLALAYAGYLGRQKTPINRVLEPVGVAVLLIAFAGVLSALRRKKAGIRCRILGALFPVFLALVLRPGIAGVQNERAVVEWMQKIGDGQDSYKEDVRSDQDKDGVGEYALFCELTGEVVPRGSEINEPLKVSRIANMEEGDFRTGASQGSGIAEKAGYCFRIYVPGPAGDSMNDRSQDGTRSKPPTALDPKEHAKIIDLQEQCYVLYAWPRSAGRTGRRAYAMTQDKKIFYTDMKAEPYSGDKAPDARTAYVKDAVPDTFFNNPFAQGETFGPNLWRSLGEETPAAPPPAATASSETGLVPGKPIPTPCAFQRMSRSDGKIFTSALLLPEEQVKVTPVGRESIELDTKGDMAGWPIAKEEFYWAPPKEDKGEPPCTVSWVEQKMTISSLTQADRDWLKAVMEKASKK